MGDVGMFIEYVELLFDVIISSVVEVIYDSVVMLVN